MAHHLAVFVRSQQGGGGAERVVLNLVRGFSERGARVDLVMARRRGLFLEEIPEHVRVVDLRAQPAFMGIPALLRARAPRALLRAAARPDAPRVLGAVGALARYLDRERPSLLLSALNYSNAVALLARRLLRRPLPVAVTIHNHLSRSAEGAEDLRGKLAPQALESLLPEADHIVAVSRGVARDIVERNEALRARVVAIHNPVVTPELEARAEEAPEHPWFAESAPRRPLLLAAGKLKPQKDFGTLLRAFAAFRHQREGRLVVLGEGPERASLLALAASLGVSAEVDFPGFLPNPYALMRRADLFVLSSAWEGFGNVLVEAMACGCPVVSTRCPSGPDEILEDGRYGELVPVGAADALAGAIARTLDAPQKPDVLRRRAAAFSLDACIARYEAELFPH